MEHRFLRACRRQPVDRTPVWLMRQAGRCLPEYRALRERHSLLELYRTPDLAAEVTLQPLRRFDVDAAILFSDIALPLEAMGLGLGEDERGGLRVDAPPSTGGDLDRLRPGDPRETLSGPLAAIRLTLAELDGHRPVIGLAGAPFTLAVYALEGGPSGSTKRVRALMYGEAARWHRLCGDLAAVTALWLRAQVEAGAQALQVFDSWVGALDERDYREYVLPHTRHLFEALADLDVPTIHYGTGTARLAEVLAEAGGDVLGLDWRAPLDEVWSRIGDGRAVQGNLDPTLMVGPFEHLLAGAADVLERAAGRPGHIFNLGHGLLPVTPIGRIDALVRYVHTHTAAAA